MVENSLHEGIKRWYSRPGDAVESQIGGYVVDIVRGDLLIEIQTGNFSAIRDKLRELLRSHPVRLVHPVPERKWIVRVDSKGEHVSRRRSPKRGRVEDVFLELVYIPELLRDDSLSLEVLLVESEDILVDDGRGRPPTLRGSGQRRLQSSRGPPRNPTRGPAPHVHHEGPFRCLRPPRSRREEDGLHSEEDGLDSEGGEEGKGTPLLSERRHRLDPWALKGGLNMAVRPQIRALCLAGTQ